MATSRAIDYSQDRRVVALEIGELLGLERGKDDFDEKAQTFFNDFHEQPSLTDVVVDQIGSGQASPDIIDRDVIQRDALFADLDFLADIEVRVKHRREMRKNR